MLSAWATLPTEDTYIARHSFSDEGYTLQISDLKNIWSETLSKSRLKDKAQSEKCVIDPSEDDSQYRKLLEKLEDGILGRNGSTLDITRNKTGSKFSMEVSMPLPKPLGSLNWEFKLSLQGDEALKSEIIVPLVGISYNHERQIADLVRLIKEKDAAILKIRDKFEGQNEHIPNHAGLRVFDERSWRAQTTSSDISSISFEKLLSQAFSSGSASDVDRLAKIPGSGSANRSQGKASQAMSQDENSIEEFQHQQTPPQSRAPEERSPPTKRNVAQHESENTVVLNQNAEAEESTEDEIEVSQPASVIAETKPAPRKLGKIGGRVTSKSVTTGESPPQVPPSTGGLGSSTLLNESSSTAVAREMPVSTTPSKQLAGVKAPEAPAPKALEPASNDDTSEDEDDKANRRREQLKREMEEKARAQPKKKRKF